MTLNGQTKHTHDSLKNLEAFDDWLSLRKLSDQTIKVYLYYYMKLIPYPSISDPVITKYLLKYNNNVSRAFLKSYLEFKKLKFDVPKLKGRKKRIKRKSLSDHELGKLREACYDLYPKQMIGITFDLSYHCGLRKSEALGIQIKDFYWEDFAKDTTKPCKLKVVKAKGKKERFVLVPPEIMRLVYYYSKGRDKRETFITTKYHTYTKYFQRITDKILGKRYTPHDLRRTRATNWHHEGRTPVQIKIRLGHANINTTMLYINPDETKELAEWEKELS